MQGNPPLAERMRPKSLDAYAGQAHLVGDGAVLRRAMKADALPSMILWGPPGVGKTTLARLIAAEKAYRVGALTADQTLRLYLGIPFTQEELNAHREKYAKNHEVPV